MAYATYTGYAETLMSFEWTTLLTPGLGTYSLGGITQASTVGTSIFLSYAGAGFAFVLSLLGAYDNAGKTLYYVEDSIADFMKGYVKGKYKDVIDLVDDSEVM